MADERTQHVGLVAAGAGARGAYEAGVIATLLPVLEARGERPTVLVGTSAGAINVALLAAMADRPAAEAGDALLELWRGLTTRDVWRPLLRSGPGTLARYAADVVGLPRPRLSSLLDTSPMRATGAAWEPLLNRARHNVRAGLIHALGVVTTDVYRGRTVVFTDVGPSVDPPHTDVRRGIDYALDPITVDHVLASSAIPIAFPPIRIIDEVAGDRWYADGGVRLNAPLKPAIVLGATKLVVVATHPDELVGGDDPNTPSEIPELDDQLAHVLDAVLVDRMVEDVRTLRMVNKLVRDGSDGDALGPYLELPHLFVGPASRDALGTLAQDVFQQDVRKLERLLPTSTAGELGLLRRLFAGTDGPRSGDTLSFLFFHPAFANAAIDRGIADAKKAIANGDDLWRC